jgi:hypothetical protein
MVDKYVDRANIKPVMGCAAIEFAENPEVDLSSDLAVPF